MNLLTDSSLRRCIDTVTSLINYQLCQDGSYCGHNFHALIIGVGAEFIGEAQFCTAKMSLGKDIEYYTCPQFLHLCLSSQDSCQ